MVVGVENAILDLNADVEDAFLREHNIREDSATFFDTQAYAALRVELARLPSARFMAGGLTQNALRVVARLAPRANFAAFVGFALGGDAEFGPRLCAELAADGVRARFAVDSESVTTVVSSLVPPSRKRSLAFSSAAPSDAFAARHAAQLLDRDAVSRQLVERAQVVYSAGWMLVVSPALVIAAAQRLAAIDSQRYFAFNLAAETIVREPNLALLLQVLPHTNVLFGNDHEFRALVIALGWFKDEQLANPLSDEQARSIVVRVASLLRSGVRRVVAMTRSALPTAVYCSDAATAEAQLFDVLPVAKIVDTTGAGDAFVGGFLCALAQRRSLTDCVALGHFAAHRIVGVQGCNVAAAIRELPDWYAPRAIPCLFRGVERSVVPFYWPGRADVWQRRLRSGCFGNFWSDVQPIEVRVGGRVGVFSTSEAAYQAMKWWFVDDVRRRFEATADGDAAFVLKLQLEAQGGIAAPAWRRKGPLELASDEKLRAIADDEKVAADELTGWRAMELVLRAKFAQPALEQLLRESGDAFLLEHNPVRGRDLVWSDNAIGDGENQLGLMLMLLRELWRPGTFPRWASAPAEWTAFQAAACRACAAVEAFWRGYEIRDAAMDDAATPADAVAAARQAPAIVALDVAHLAIVTDNDDACARCEITTSHFHRHDDLVLTVDADKFRQLFAVVREDEAADIVVGGVAAPALCVAQRSGIECAFLGFALGGADGETRDGERVVSLMRAAGVRSRFVVEPAMHTSADAYLMLRPYRKPLRVSRRDGGAPSRAFATRFAGALFDNDTESDRLLVGARVMLTSASYAAAVGSDAALGAVRRFYAAGGARLVVLALDNASALRTPSLATVFDVVQQATVVIGTCNAFAALAVESAWFEDLHEPLSDSDATAIAVRLAPRLRTDSRCIVVITRETRPTVVHADGALQQLQPIGSVGHSVFVGRFLAALARGSAIPAAVSSAVEQQD